MSEALSITYVVPYNPFGSSTLFGASVSAGELAIEMAKRGHSVTVVHSYVTRRQYTLNDGVRVHGIPNRQYPYVGGWTANLAVSKFLAGSGKKPRDEIIDTRGGALGWAFRRSAPLWSAHVFRAVDVSLAEWRRLPLAPRLQSAPKYFMTAYNERLCVQVADCIVVETASVGQDLAQMYPSASAKWKVLPPLMPRSRSSSRGVSCDPTHFLFIGAGPRRDTGLFLQSLHLLAQQGISVKATILRENRRELRELATSWKLNVRFVTRLSEDEMRKTLAESCAFVLPSFREAFCRTVVEAAFHGTPSVVSDLASVREFVRDGQNGMVVASWNPKDWARALQLLIQDPDLRNRLGEAAKAMATQNYSAERVGSLTEKGYRDMLSGG